MNLNGFLMFKIHIVLKRVQNYTKMNNKIGCFLSLKCLIM